MVLIKDVKVGQIVKLKRTNMKSRVCKVVKKGACYLTIENLDTGKLYEVRRKQITWD